MGLGSIYQPVEGRSVKLSLCADLVELVNRIRMSVHVASILRKEA